MDRQYNEIIKIMPARLRPELEAYLEAGKDIQEIRVRKGKPVHIIDGRQDKRMKFSQTDSVISSQDMREMTEYVLGYSMYAHEEELRQGFVTLKGGHRVGIAGEVAVEEGSARRIKSISSFNIRVSRQVKGCGDRIMKYADKNMLFISPPRMGKTTLLRDVLRQLANRPMENIGVVDERSEIAACYYGVPENDMGERVDVLDGCPKAEGMMMLLRSMSPTVIGVDELGRKEDVEAVLRVVNCGVRVIATIHGDSLYEIRRKEFLQELFNQNIFESYILLGKGKWTVYNREYNAVEEILC